MAEETTKQQEPVTPDPKETEAAETTQPAEEVKTEAVQEPAPQPEPDPLAEAQAALEKEHDNYLRLAAEYDNFRKRSQKEKDDLYTVIKAETVGKFLPVYDNLERALAQETADEAYKKGVEMTMNQLVKVMEGLGVTSFGEIGEAFDPARHNAVMHVEQEGLGENVIAEVFQKGFLVGEKVIRFAMVKVAN